MKRIILISLCFLFFNCANNTQNQKTEFIELPYHTNIEWKKFSYLVSNPPQNKKTLFIDMIKLYKKNPIRYYIGGSGTYFYEKNRKTSYFLKHKDVDAIMEYKVLDDYFYGTNNFERFGLGTIFCSPNKNDSTKQVYEILYFDSNGEIKRLTLRDEYTPNWYEQHKDNELVRLFNEGEPF